MKGAICKLIDIKIENNSSKPIYVQISNELKRNISLGNFDKGEKLPSEDSLVKEIGVSRGTVRKAITELVNEGVLEKIQGKGTYVSQDKISYPFAQELISYAESMKNKGLDFSTEVLLFNKIVPNLKIKNRLSLKDDEQVFYIVRKRSVKGKPAILLYNWVSVKLCPNLGNYDFTHIGLFEAIEKEIGEKIDFGIRNFSANKLSLKQSNLLDLEENSPILNIGQVTFINCNTPIECSEVLLRTDQYQVSSLLYRK